MTEWNYDGDADGVMESYEGCSATADWDQSWCYVQGGSNYAQVARVRLLQLHDGVELRWRCRRGYGGVRGLQRHSGLGPELVLRAGRFQLQPSPELHRALDSTVAGETRKWRECGSCNCMTECGTTMAMPTGLWSRTRAAAPQRTGTRAGATYRAVPIVTRPWTPPWPARRASGASAAPATA
ncbi:unnamed protein product [Prorocentrum cordatum]|uniref:Kringle domain-containing protein n=1 Tax=Prorocentrum cordatum TaxID=2364126 RepID=A0ABN9PAR0_9DINO|nr:unnamed protein product [Polarella glacialis]